MVFKIRKLCSSTEEYEANADGPVDIDAMSERLSIRPGIETSRSDSILTALFEDEGIVVRVFPSGRALIQANQRKDAERVCSILSKSSEGVKTETRAERN